MQGQSSDTTAPKNNAASFEKTDVLIIGAGFAGLGMAIKLSQQGKRRFLILDREADVGGTWQINTYPGCACDVHSHLYSYSFEPNPQWSRMFSPQPEIWNYLRHCADKYQLRPNLRMRRTVQEARFDEQQGLWTVTTDTGERYQAPILISGIGALDVPAWPDIPGLKDFAGPVFHSQQWDHSQNLEGTRVAVIGTGASAIQFVPQIQPKVSQLKLFQRTPPWILPKPDRAVSRFEHWLFRKLPAAQRLYRRFIYWFLESRVMGFVIQPKVLRLAELGGRLHIRRQIKNPALREKVTPRFRLGCKRVLISNDYYPALDQANVDLITTGIERISERGIHTQDGQLHEADVIVLGTGFKATEPLKRGMIFGLGGTDIVDAWEGSLQAYKGTTVSGFPNLFMLNGPNTGLGHSSVVFTIESQLAYIFDALDQMDRKQLRWVNVRAEVQTRYNDWLQKKLAGTIWNTGGCRSWYQDKHGRNVALWPGFTFGFRRMLRRFDLEHYETRQ